MSGAMSDKRWTSAICRSPSSDQVTCIYPNAGWVGGRQPAKGRAAPEKRTARKVDLHEGDQSRKIFYAKANLAAAVFDATAGSPAVRRAGPNCPYYQTKPDLTPSGRLLEAKDPAQLIALPRVLSPAVSQTS